eukprot:CAMPEP_0203956042 /NCGR_PEP_ID=MMETSP0359-20131031/88462_1 /ASSEMBLY_ACC=CAM_ASM_000338 /TAXON_ID=268821 /ORGANISM="Scrippsiella Hangoei, Strain SHTV-5" /LENGTH=35 /DNA_ID= /DNA_START= /DNA_END= /DNA_ORIENTATION=
MCVFPRVEDVEAPAAYSVGPAGGGAIPPAPMPHAA